MCRLSSPLERFRDTYASILIAAVTCRRNARVKGVATPRRAFCVSLFAGGTRRRETGRRPKRGICRKHHRPMRVLSVAADPEIRSFLASSCRVFHLSPRQRGGCEQTFCKFLFSTDSTDWVTALEVAARTSHGERVARQRNVFPAYEASVYRLEGKSDGMD